MYAVYCLGTDGVNMLVTGTARHGRVRSVPVVIVQPNSAAKLRCFAGVCRRLGLGLRTIVYSI